MARQQVFGKVLLGRVQARQEDRRQRPGVTVQRPGDDSLVLEKEIYGRLNDLLWNLQQLRGHGDQFFPAVAAVTLLGQMEQDVLHASTGAEVGLLADGPRSRRSHRPS